MTVDTSVGSSSVVVFPASPIICSCLCPCAGNIPESVHRLLVVRFDGSMEILDEEGFSCGTVTNEDLVGVNVIGIHPIECPLDSPASNMLFIDCSGNVYVCEIFCVPRPCRMQVVSRIECPPTLVHRENAPGTGVSDVSHTCQIWSTQAREASSTYFRIHRKSISMATGLIQQYNSPLVAFDVRSHALSSVEFRVTEIPGQKMNLKCLSDNMWRNCIVGAVLFAESEGVRIAVLNLHDGRVERHSMPLDPYLTNSTITHVTWAGCRQSSEPPRILAIAGRKIIVFDSASLCVLFVHSAVSFLGKLQLGLPPHHASSHNLLRKYAQVSGNPSVSRHVVHASLQSGTQNFGLDDQTTVSPEDRLQLVYVDLPGERIVVRSTESSDIGAFNWNTYQWTADATMPGLTTGEEEIFAFSACNWDNSDLTIVMDNKRPCIRFVFGSSTGSIAGSVQARVNRVFALTDVFDRLLLDSSEEVQKGHADIILISPLGNTRLRITGEETAEVLPLNDSDISSMTDSAFQGGYTCEAQSIQLHVFGTFDGDVVIQSSFNQKWVVRVSSEFSIQSVQISKGNSQIMVGDRGGTLYVLGAPTTAEWKIVKKFQLGVLPVRIAALGDEQFLICSDEVFLFDTETLSVFTVKLGVAAPKDLLVVPQKSLPARTASDHPGSSYTLYCLSAGGREVFELALENIGRKEKSSPIISTYSQPLPAFKRLWQIVAVPNALYAFASWEEGNNLVSGLVELEIGSVRSIGALYENPSTAQIRNVLPFKYEEDPVCMCLWNHIVLGTVLVVGTRAHARGRLLLFEIHSGTIQPISKTSVPTREISALAQITPELLALGGTDSIVVVSLERTCDNDSPVVLHTVDVLNTYSPVAHITLLNETRRLILVVLQNGELGMYGMTEDNVLTALAKQDSARHVDSPCVLLGNEKLICSTVDGNFLVYSTTAYEESGVLTLCHELRLGLHVACYSRDDNDTTTVVTTSGHLIHFQRNFSLHM